MGKLPEFKDWKWPWVEGQVDEARAAEMIYNLKKQYETQGEELKTAKTSVTALTSELDDVKAGKSGTDEEAQKELKDLRAKVRDFEKTAGKPRTEDELEIARLSVALDLGLTKSQARRLVGSTREEIEADGKDYAEENGIELPGNDGDARRERTKPGGNTPIPAGELRFGNARSQSISLDSTDPDEMDKLLPAL